MQLRYVTIAEECFRQFDLTKLPFEASWGLSFNPEGFFVIRLVAAGRGRKITACETIDQVSLAQESTPQRVAEMFLLRMQNLVHQLMKAMATMVLEPGAAGQAGPRADPRHGPLLPSDPEAERAAARAIRVDVEQTVESIDKTLEMLR